MKTPGQWSLDWANHELNGMSWKDIVEGIRAEAREDCTPECFMNPLKEARRRYATPQDDEGTRP